MPIKRMDLLFFLLALAALLISLVTIVVHIGFVLLPLLFLVAGMGIAFLPASRGMALFFFLLPLVNSLPAFFFNGYAFNLMAVVLFLLSGIIIGSSLKDGIPKISGFEWSGPYFYFLITLWISVIFLFLRWSNITLPSGGFMADTPVGPGVPQNPRISYAVIFPVITLFLFSVTPFTAALIRRYSLTKERVFNSLIPGYWVSVGIALYQKLGDNSFMSISWWGERMSQYNGGFSDFNGFGFFSGVIFLYTALRLLSLPGSPKMIPRKELLLIVLTLPISFLGVVLSGSRTSFLFVIFAFIYLFFSKVKRSIKIVFPVIVIVALLVSGGTLIKRFEETLDTSRARSKNAIDIADRFSNGRIWMIKNSIPMIAAHPVSGIGAGNFFFYLSYMKYGEWFIKDLPLNQYLLFLDELGIPGLLLFLIFVFVLMRKKKNLYSYILGGFLLVMLVGNSLWLPEILVLFWILAAFLPDKGKRSQTLLVKLKPVFPILLVLFIVGNILSFNSLHPSKLMADRGLPYDFGFWEESVDAGFRWTKEEAGMLLTFDEKGEYGPLKFFCGAPIGHLPGKAQSLKVYVNGKRQGSKDFRSNGEYQILLKGDPGEPFMLKMEVSPVFNLKKMGLGPESRDLGVQFYSVSEGP